MKISHYIVILLVTMIISCKDQKQNNAASEQKMDVVSVNFNTIEGAGSEPNWSISIIKNDSVNFTFELVTMLGTKRNKGMLTLKDAPKTQANGSYHFIGKDVSGQAIDITYIEQSCLNMAEENLGGAIRVKYNEDVLNGCAKMVKNQ